MTMETISDSYSPNLHYYMGEESYVARISNFPYFAFHVE